MWCTRWFLALVILPLPTAPPYFLAVFLVSSFLHTRPCFYCMVLLTALFTSSCYWEAVPIDVPLTRPLGNATTFGDAIRSNLSTPDVELPPLVQLVDRCWCNVFSRSGLFEPSDVSVWERASVEATRRGIEMQWRRNEEKTGAESGDGEASERDEDKADVGDENTTGYVSPGAPFSLRALRDILFPTMSTAPTHKYRLKPASSHTSTPPSPTEIQQETAFSPTETASQSERIDTSSNSNTADSRTTSMTEPTRLLRPYYDLRPYGLDITVDFRWNR